MSLVAQWFVHNDVNKAGADCNMCRVKNYHYYHIYNSAVYRLLLSAFPPCHQIKERLFGKVGHTTELERERLGPLHILNILGGGISLAGYCILAASTWRCQNTQTVASSGWMQVLFGLQFFKILFLWFTDQQISWCQQDHLWLVFWLVYHKLPKMYSMFAQQT